MTLDDDTPAIENLLPRLRLHLAQIPDWITLVQLMQPPSSSRAGGGPSTPANERVPLRLEVLQLTRTDDTRRRIQYDPDIIAGMDDPSALCELASWVALASGDLLDAGVEVIPPSDEPTVAGCAGWLTLHLDDIAAMDWAVAMAQSIAKLHKRIGRLLGERTPYRPHCRYCDGRLRQRDEHDGTWGWSCPACGATYAVDTEIRDLLARQEVTVATAAGQLGIPTRTMQRWVTQTGLEPAGGTTGRPTYRLGDLATIARLRAPKNL